MVCGDVVRLADGKYSLPVDSDWLQYQAFPGKTEFSIFGMQTDKLKTCMTKDGPGGRLLEISKKGIVQTCIYNSSPTRSRKR